MQYCIFSTQCCSFQTPLTCMSLDYSDLLGLGSSHHSVLERLPNTPVFHKHCYTQFLHVSFTFPSCLLFKCPVGLGSFSFLGSFLISCFSLCIVSAFNSLGYFHCKVMLHQLLIELFCHFKLPLFNCNLQPFFQIILRTKYKPVSKWFQKRWQLRPMREATRK